MGADKCGIKDTKYTVYLDEDCKKVDKGWMKKFGKIPKSDYHLWSGDCEEAHRGDMKWSVEIQCDEEGFHQKAWLKNTKCKGEPTYDFTYEWGQCSKVAVAEV